MDHTAASAALYLTERGYLADGGGRTPGKHPPRADTIRRMILNGRLPARRVGYIWLIAQPDLDNLIAAQIEPPPDGLRVKDSQGERVIPRVA